MPEQLLFIGHSLVGYKMPEMFNSFMNTLGVDAQADRQVINGSPLRFNWDNGNIAEGVNARAVLPSGAYDSVIITEALPLDEHIRWNNSQGYAERYYDLARSANPDTRFYIYETWHNISGDGAAWRAQIDADLPKWEGIADYINSNAPNGAIPAMIVPAGQAMAKLYDAIQAGQVPGVTSIRAVFEDTIHLNDLGNWFMAALQAATVMGIDPDSLPSDTVGRWNTTYDGPNGALKSALSDVISDTLAEYDRDGRDGALRPVEGQQDSDPWNDPDPVVDDVPAQDPAENDDGGSGQGGGGWTPAQPSTPASGDIEFGLGFGLSTVADYVSNMPFIDVFKTSRAPLGHEPGRWGGVDFAELQARGALDADGWLTFIPDGVNYVGSLILTSFPAEMTEAAGRYRVTWDGEGDVRIGLSASNVAIGQNEAWFTYTPTGSALVNIEIHETDPRGNGNYVRNISVVKEENISAFEAGQMFNPTWIDVIEDAHSLRFMDWMRTNNSKIETLADAPLETDATWTPDGVPLSVMVRLANETGTDPWFTIPHLADETYMRAFVTQVRDTLDPGLKAYFEFSNEVWNFQFGQAQHSNAEGQARFPGEGTAWVQNYAADAVVLARIIDDVYGADSPNAIKVIGTQTGWIGLEGAILDAPSWVAENPGFNAAPATYFDAYAITGYFDGGLGRGDKPVTLKNWLVESQNRAVSAANSQGLSGAARDAYIEEHRFDYATTLAARELRDGSVTGDSGGSLADLRTQFAYHKAIADERGLELIMYEGGTHVVGVGSWVNDTALTEFFTHLNYSPEMGVLYAELLQIWEQEGGTLFNAFTAVGTPSKYGSWGHLRYLGDDNPRMDVIEEFIADNPRAESGGPFVEPPTAVVNSAPDGMPGIVGTPQEGETLTAVTQSVSDADGILRSSFAYQWQRDGQNIGGATSATYTLTQQDVGAQIRVNLQFTDARGTLETVQSGRTVPVEDRYQAPLQASIRVDGDGTVGAVLAAQASFTGGADAPDDGAGSWRWIRTDAAGQQREIIQGAQSQYYTLRAEDQGHVILAEFSFRDASGSAGVATGGNLFVNTAPTGRVTIVTVPGRDGFLTADTSALSDADGIVASSLTFQWFLDNAPIAGATQARFFANAADLAGSLSVRVTYLDQSSFTENVISDPVPMSSDGIRLNGTDFADRLIGGTGGDTLLGADGDDIFVPGAGSDFLDGGRGVDTVALLGDQSAYTLRLASNGSRLTDRRDDDNGGQGSKTLFAIETLDFETEIDVLQGRPLQLSLLDDAVAVSNSDLEDITELYVAYFNRAPDAIGLTYWASLFANGLDLEQMARGFFDQPETRATYADVLSSDGARLTDVDGFVSAVYANVLGRIPDADGFAFWVTALENVPEITPATFILSVLGGAKFPADPTPQTLVDQSYIATKTDIGTYFAAIKGLSDVDDARVVMSLYDGTIGGMLDAVTEVNDIYADALDPQNGEFLLQLVGVVDDPFATFF